MKSGTLFGANVITAGLNGRKGGAEALLDPLCDFDKFWSKCYNSVCKKNEMWGNVGL